MSTDKELEELQFEELQHTNDILRGEIIRTETQLEVIKHAKYMTEEEKAQLGVGRGDYSFSSSVAYPRKW